MAELLKGKVKWFSDEKGFGFIERQLGDDVFFHHTALVTTEPQQFKMIDEGVTVTFELEASEKGPRAVNVQVIPAT